jgi:hypothetical protein
MHPVSTAAVPKPEVKTHRKMTFSTASEELTPITALTKSMPTNIVLA